jgi:serine/threonine-protein kinase
MGRSKPGAAWSSVYTRIKATDMKRIDKYEILEEIGRGGFATVYRAQDTRLDREVALKILHPDLSNQPATVQRLRREATAAAKLYS